MQKQKERRTSGDDRSSDCQNHADADADDSSESDEADSQSWRVKFGPQPWRNPDRLYELYHDEGLSQREIADKFDVSQPTIGNWMDRHDIETRPPMNERGQSISCYRRADGRIQFNVPDGDGERLALMNYQLVVLLAEDCDGEWLYDPAEVFADDTVVHHLLHALVPVDIPENLDVVDAVEHIHLHGGGYPDKTEVVLGELFGEAYDGEPDRDQWGDGANDVVGVEGDDTE